MQFSLIKLLIAVAVASATMTLSLWTIHPFFLPTAFLLTALGVIAYLFSAFRTMILVFVPVALLAAPILTVFVSQFSPIYYSQFNQVRRELEQLPGVTIVAEWKHEDVTLEDCSFTIRTSDSPDFEVQFWEGQNWLRLFNRIDGVVLHSKDGTIRNASVSDLASAGIDVSRIADVVAEISALLPYLKSRPSGTDWPNGRWLHVAEK